MNGKTAVQGLRTAVQGLSMVVLRKEVKRKLRQVGVWGTVKHGGAKLIRELGGLFSTSSPAQDPFDLKYGTDTAGVLGVGALDIPEDQMEHAVRYGAISEEEFVRLLQGLSIDYKQFTFVDLGSGKGRALLMAAQFGFKEVIGVEFSRMLHETAERNIALFRAKCGGVSKMTSVHADAGTYEPPADPLLVFMHNPFDDAVMKRVVERLEASLQQHPRQICILYVKPVQRHLFDSAQRMKLVGDSARHVFYRAGIYWIALAPAL